MSHIHTCSYFCTRPACVLAQRNELRDEWTAHLANIEYKPVTPKEARDLALNWQLQAGGEIVPMLTTNELAGLINEYAKNALRLPNLQASDIFNHQPQPKKGLKNED